MKGFILKPHEAQALAAGQPVVIWRAVKPQPIFQYSVEGIWRKKKGAFYIAPDLFPTSDEKKMVIGCALSHGSVRWMGQKEFNESYGPFAVGVPLFGKETWCEGEGPIFRAEWDRFYEPNELRGMWKPSTTMPERIARVCLTLSDVKVRRPCDVTEEEAKAMGFIGGHGSIPNYPFSATPREHWKAQWGWPEPKTDWSLYHFTALATPQHQEP